ncbi:MAG: LPS export ABC transporter permease LptF [Deltaproteobacteria bacterium]|nr:MAG: LPS export ABC transporter permease LptF [Deltaproteobacteria bacterium]
MIIERYLILEIAHYGLLGLVLFSFAFLGGKLFRFVEMLLERGIPLYYAGKLLLLMMPSFLVYVIPMATLLGVLLALTRMSSDREILALKTSGVGITKLLKPALILSLFAAISTGALTLYGVPWSIRAFKGSLFEAARSAVQPRIRERVFCTFVPHVVLYAQKVREDGRIEGIMLFDERDQTRKILILAKSGWLSVDRESGRLSLFLNEGELHQQEEGSYSIMRFNRYVFNVFREELLKEAERKARVRLLEKEMSIRELREKIRQRQKEGKDIRPQLVELHLKFALPFSPLILGLLGVGLGSHRTRSGRSFGLVLSLFVIIFYYVLYLIGKALSTSGLLPPWAGAWFPNLSLLVLGIYLLKKSAAESPVMILEVLEHGLEFVKRRK